MEISSSTTPTSVAGTAATTGAAINGLSQSATAKPPQQVDYMKLIVAQMKNMNPMDPASGGDSLPIMLQAESLNQLTTLNKALKELQTVSQTGYAAGLMGRTVNGVDESNAAVSGVVRGVKMDASGPMLELSTGKRLRLLNVTGVADA